MTPKRGDVVLIPFPYTDLGTNKRRPVLLPGDVDEYGDFLAVAITSQPGHADVIALDDTDFEQGALPKKRWLRGARLYTLNQDCIAGLFGALAPAAFARLHAEVCRRLGCQS